MNFATVQKLPVVYICNNNQYAYSTPLNLQMACANVADRGPAYNMPAEIVDGNDVLAVYEATQRAVEHARARPGPVPAGVQDLPHDRPLRARRRPLRAQGTVRRVGANSIRSCGSEAHAGRRLGASRATWTRRQAAVKAEVDDAVAWADQSP